MPLRPLPLSIVLGAGVPGDFGLNVTCCPVSSTATHSVVDRHATPARWLAASNWRDGYGGADGVRRRVECDLVAGVVDRGALSGSGAIHGNQGVRAVDAGHAGRSKIGRVKRDLGPGVVDRRALVGRRASDAIQAVAAVEGDGAWGRGGGGVE